MLIVHYLFQKDFVISLNRELKNELEIKSQKLNVFML